MFSKLINYRRFVYSEYNPYCHNPGRWGISISMYGLDYNTNIYPYPNATFSEFPECKWRFYLASSLSTNITISRNSTNNDERFYMYFYQSYNEDQSTHLFTKDIISWDTNPNIVNIPSRNRRLHIFRYFVIFKKQFF